MYIESSRLRQVQVTQGLVFQMVEYQLVSVVLHVTVVVLCTNLKSMLGIAIFVFVPEDSFVHVAHKFLNST